MKITFTDCALFILIIFVTKCICDVIHDGFTSSTNHTTNNKSYIYTYFDSEGKIKNTEIKRNSYLYKDIQPGESVLVEDVTGLIAEDGD